MANVVNDLVGYNNRKIVQNSDYFNFSLESVLLPRFCIITKKTKKILDFCTGNGPIPLILSTLTDSKIIGVEIQKEVYELAKESIELNNLTNQIEILNLDVKELTQYYDTDSFDLITCNPPYFKVQKDSNLNCNMVKSIARHEIEVTLSDICSMAKKLLKNDANFVMVHRTERLSEIIETLRKNNLEPKRIQFIYPKESTISNLVLIDSVKNGKVGLSILPPLICHNSDGTYTEKVMNMFER